MEQQIRSYFFGAIGFAFAVTWTTLGLASACAAVALCCAGANFHHFLRFMNGTRATRESPHRRRRPDSVESRSSRDADEYELVPDEPSLIFSLQA